MLRPVRRWCIAGVVAVLAVLAVLGAGLEELPTVPAEGSTAALSASAEAVVAVVPVAPPAPAGHPAPARRGRDALVGRSDGPVKARSARQREPLDVARARMMHAVGRLPGYHPGEATWVMTPGLKHWGLTSLRRHIVWISPEVPASRMYDVVAHEWSHVLAMRTYGGDVPRAVAALNDWFGGTRLTGAERAADCMARLLGARWTHYTRCASAQWQRGARELLARRVLR